MVYQENGAIALKCIPTLALSKSGSGYNLSLRRHPVLSLCYGANI